MFTVHTYPLTESSKYTRYIYIFIHLRNLSFFPEKEDLKSYKRRGIVNRCRFIRQKDKITEEDRKLYNALPDSTFARIGTDQWTK